MSINRRIMFGAATVWLNRAMLIALRLVLIPVLMRYRPKEEVGLWMLLGQTSSYICILDLGLGATITRRIALAKGRSGSDPDAPLTAESQREIADLIESGRVMFLWLAIAAFVICNVGGYFYLRLQHMESLSLSTMCLAWGLLSACATMGVWAETWRCLAQGIGYVGWDSAINSVLETATVAAQIVAVVMGGGLVMLAALMVPGPTLMRRLLRVFVMKRRPELFGIRGRLDRSMIRSMIVPSLHAWLTTAGLAVILAADGFLITHLKGVAEIPNFRAAWLVFYNLNVLSVAVATASAVFVSHLWQAGRFDEVRRLVMRNLRFGLSIVACGGGCALALGPRLFDVWLPPGNFIGYSILTIFFITFLLDTQATIISTCSRATEDEVFGLWALAAGVLKIVLSLVLGARYGLVGIALATLVSLLLTSHWFMTYRGLRRLRMSLWQHVIRVVVPVALVFGATVGGVRLVESLLHDASKWTVVLAAGAVSGVVLAVALWILTLERAERERALSYFNMLTVRRVR